MSLVVRSPCAPLPLLCSSSSKGLCYLHVQLPEGGNGRSRDEWAHGCMDLMHLDSAERSL